MAETEWANHSVSAAYPRGSRPRGRAHGTSGFASGFARSPGCTSMCTRPKQCLGPLCRSRGRGAPSPRPAAQAFPCGRCALGGIHGDLKSKKCLKSASCFHTRSARRALERARLARRGAATDGGAPAVRRGARSAASSGCTGMCTLDFPAKQDCAAGKPLGRTPQRAKGAGQSRLPRPALRGNGFGHFRRTESAPPAGAGTRNQFSSLNFQHEIRTAALRWRRAPRPHDL